jgi:pantothenate kinase
MIFFNAAATGNADWFLMKPPALNTFRTHSAFLRTQNILNFVAYIKLQDAVKKCCRILTMCVTFGTAYLRFHSPLRVKMKNDQQSPHDEK